MDGEREPETDNRVLPFRPACFYEIGEVEVNSIERRVKRELERLAEAGLDRRLRPVAPLSARECMVGVPPRRCVDFSSNNYLALADRPELKEEAIHWTERLGTGSRASRLISGTSLEVLELEKRVAAWKGFEAALIIGSGYMANVGLIPALVGRGGFIAADKLNHASLNDGCRLSGAKFIRYRHLDMEDLKRKSDYFLEGLAKDADTDYPSICRGGMLVSDTVFSMDGDVADVAALAAFARKRSMLLYCDDAHATGVFGPKGEGLAVANAADVAMGTFSKALGCYGAYVACSRRLRDWFVAKCGSFVYSTAPPPAVYGAISAALDLVASDEFRGIRAKLLANAEVLVGRIGELGFDTGSTSTPIVPVLVGSPEETLRIANALLERGILVPAIRLPTVPRGSARLRISLNAAHREEDFDALIDALREVA